MKFCAVLFFALICIVQVIAAPKPITWEDFKKGVVDFGRKAGPVLRTGCQLLNRQPQQPQQYPQYQEDRQFQQYPQFRRPLPHITQEDREYINEFQNY